ncbi:MAG: type II toxin-antitoxin system HicA family toxin, partial [Nitrospinota bacterium]
STLEWRKLEALFIACGAKIIEGHGSRVRFELNDIVATFHRPHPEKEAKTDKKTAAQYKNFITD